MRLLRAFARLFVALAFVSVTAAQARDVGLAPSLAAHHHVQHAHQHGPVMLDHAVHQPCHPEKGDVLGADTPVHDLDGCRTACCFSTAQLPLRVTGATAIEFVRSVSYVVVAQTLSGRAFGPDPEIPKRA